ncbi:LamG domain-containing protein [Coraliomargarita parva]|uniref:LamG domain-containing protein n=1 Tax=Coraliomargarita parva TaxID=3014050 RepID=UPI0022B2F641|nr:LamG domain-containing protein [Coraliomargarita parva]
MTSLTPKIIGKLTATTALFVAMALSSEAQTLISHYTLDGTVADSGSLGIDGALLNDAGFTAGGAGSFSQALSTDSVGSQNFFRADTSDNSAFGLDAITIAMWVNISSFNDTDRLLSNVTSSTGFDFYLTNSGTSSGDYRLVFNFNSTSGAVYSSDDAALQTTEWVFVAVTYDSSIVSGDNVFFYVGNESTSLALTSGAQKSGSIVTSTADLEIGGTPATGNDRTPVSLFNDVRIYDGALSLSELEGLRVAVIPEPSTYAMGLGLIGLLFVFARRQRK